MNKKMKTFVGAMLLAPFILIFSILIFDSAFLHNKEKEVVVEGKANFLPYSELVNVSDGKYIKQKVAQHLNEYFLNVRVGKDLFLIQTNENIFNQVQKNDKIKVTIQENRFTHHIHVNPLGINPLSSEQLANRQEEIRNIVKEQFKNK
jgi:hypothetical protein